MIFFDFFDFLLFLDFIVFCTLITAVASLSSDHFCCVLSLTGGVLFIAPGAQFYDMSGSHLLPIYFVESWMVQFCMFWIWNTWLPEGTGKDLVPLSSLSLLMGLLDLSLNLSCFYRKEIMKKYIEMIKLVSQHLHYLLFWYITSESWPFTFFFFWRILSLKSNDEEEVFFPLSFFMASFSATGKS